MNIKFLSASWLFAALLMAVSPLSRAEAPSRSAAPLTITPEMIQQASTSVQPSKNAPYRLSKEVEPQDIFHDIPRSLEHIPNGCAQNGASLCFDYRAGHAVYKPMRTLLPAIPGMTPHNLSIRRDKIVAQYTFK